MRDLPRAQGRQVLRASHDHPRITASSIATGLMAATPSIFLTASYFGRGAGAANVVLGVSLAVEFAAFAGGWILYRWLYVRNAAVLADHGSVEVVTATGRHIRRPIDRAELRLIAAPTNNVLLPGPTVYILLLEQGCARGRLRTEGLPVELVRAFCEAGGLTLTGDPTDVRSRGVWAREIPGSFVPTWKQVTWTLGVMGIIGAALAALALSDRSPSAPRERVVTCGRGQVLAITAAGEVECRSPQPSSSP